MTATEFGLRDSRIKCYKLVNGYPTIRVDRRGVSATEQYIIDSAWDPEPKAVSHSFSPERLMDACFPAPWFSTHLDRNALWLYVNQQSDRWRPRAMPGTEGFADTELRATRVHIDPLSPDLPADPFRADADDPEHYQTCYRATIDYDSYHDKFTHEITGSGQFLSYDSHNTRLADITVDETGSWTLDKTEVNEHQQMQSMQLRQVTDHTFRWPRLFAPRFNEINKQLGKINEEPFKLIDNAPQNTVLFMGYSANRIEQAEWTRIRDDPDRLSAFEYPLYDFSIHFSQLMTEEDENIYGWNFVYGPTYEKYIYITNGEENSPSYQRYDFNKALNYFPHVRDFIRNLGR